MANIFKAASTDTEPSKFELAKLDCSRFCFEVRLADDHATEFHTNLSREISVTNVHFRKLNWG